MHCDTPLGPAPPRAASLAALLPLTSKQRHPSPSSTSAGSNQQLLLTGITSLAQSLLPQPDPPPSPSPSSPQQHIENIDVSFILGIDENDDTTRLLVPDITARLLAGSSPLVRVHVALELFPQHLLDQLPPGPICWMWDRLAKAALAAATATATVAPDVLLLLGDDVEVSPAGWPVQVLQRFARDPALMCLLLKDRADPGYPSFPAVRARHLEIFGSMLPAEFTNQGGDPFLAELYRRSGGLQMCADVAVHNQVGGIQLPDDCRYVRPRYPRRYLPKGVVLELLDAWSLVLQQRGGAEGPVLSVDVLVPSYRADVEGLERIMELCDRLGPHQAADVRFGIVIDRPSCPPEVRARLRALQSSRRWLGRLRLRFNALNLGASGTRNKLLEESLSSHVIFLDDDVTPSTDLVPAYLRAFAQHPQARGFAGPTFLPRSPATLASCALHLSDVSFFWDAPSTMTVVPWAVTANVAFKNTSTCFDLRFPKTGGGEDIDFCLRACPQGLLAVPEAQAHHPLWNNGGACFLRFAKWAIGDGQLAGMYGGRYTYWAAPNATELLWFFALLSAAQMLAYLAMALPVDVEAPAPLRCGAAAALSPPWGWMALRLVAAECLLDLVRNLAVQSRRRRCPGASLAKRAASSLHASAIKMSSESGRIAGHLARAGRCCWAGGASTGSAAGSRGWCPGSSAAAGPGWRCTRSPCCCPSSSGAAEHRLRCRLSVTDVSAARRLLSAASDSRQ